LEQKVGINKDGEEMIWWRWNYQGGEEVLRLFRADPKLSNIPVLIYARQKNMPRTMVVSGDENAGSTSDWKVVCDFIDGLVEKDALNTWADFNVAIPLSRIEPAVLTSTVYAPGKKRGYGRGRWWTPTLGAIEA